MLYAQNVSTYNFENCFAERANGQGRTKLCKNIKYPNHPNVSRRLPCNTALLKTVVTCKGESLVPILVYPYYPLHLSMKQLALKPGFLNSGVLRNQLFLWMCIVIYMMVLYGKVFLLISCVLLTLTYLH